MESSASNRDYRREFAIMRTVCAAGETIAGFDISSYQPTVNWPLLKKEGNQFCFIKASEGLHKDPCFDKHWAEARANGLLRGAYHYFHPSHDPVSQGNYFANLIGKLGAGDLPCVMDWETTDGFPSSVDVMNALAFLNVVERVTGKTPIIYSGPYFLQTLSLSEGFTKYALWLAHYGVKCPLVPSPWSYWSFWQYSDAGNLDQNKFNGPLENLEKFAK